MLDDLVARLQVNSFFASLVEVCSRANVFLTMLLPSGVYWGLWKRHLWNCHELYRGTERQIENLYACNIALVVNATKLEHVSNVLRKC